MTRCALLFAISFLVHSIHAGISSYSIDGKVEGIESGNVYVIDIELNDTIGQAPIVNHFFLIQESWPDASIEVITSLLIAVQSDKSKSISCPLAVEPASISLLLYENDVPKYAGTPLQDKFSRFVLQSSALNAQLFDRATGEIVDSIQNELTKRTEEFYLENKGTAMEPFLSLIIADIIGRKLADPADFSVISTMCTGTDSLTKYEREICKAISRHNLQWMKAKPVDIIETKYNGEEFRLANVLGEKIVILDFWASWCGPCIKEFPKLKMLEGKYDIQIVGISIDRNQQAWQDAVAKLDLPWINLRDTSGQIAKSYNVTAVPTKFVIGKEGLIISRNPEDVEQVLRELSKN